MSTLEKIIKDMHQILRDEYHIDQDINISTSIMTRQAGVDARMFLRLLTCLEKKYAIHFSDKALAHKAITVPCVLASYIEICLRKGEKT